MAKAEKAQAKKQAETAAETTKKPVAKKKSKKRRNVPEGRAYIQASYNNTIITIAEQNGNVLAWGSAGSSGFKGTRKATPYAAQVSAENTAEKAKVFGVERVHVFIKGVGAGREQAIRGLISKGMDILSISDVTPVPHNGCRKRKARRV